MHRPCGFSAPWRQVLIFIPAHFALACGLHAEGLSFLLASAAVTLLAVSYMRAGPVSLEEYSGDAVHPITHVDFVWQWGVI